MTIIAIGVGRHVDNNELKAIAMGKQENTLHVNNSNDLHTKINVILAQKECVGQGKTNYIYMLTASKCNKYIV